MSPHTTAINLRHEPGEPARVRTLDRIVNASASVEGVRVEDVQPGDSIVMRTRNSIYTITALGAGNYRVDGGWFRTAGQTRDPVRIAGCTWGGTAIHTGLVAAPGMFVEFGNGVRTTRVQDVRLLRTATGRVH